MRVCEVRMRGGDVVESGADSRGGGFGRRWWSEL